MHNLNQQQLRHHAAIGGVALVWTQLENHHQHMLWWLAGLENNVGRCITQHMNFPALRNAILTVAHESERHKPIAEELEKLLGRTEQLSRRRNDTVHALWGIIVGEGAPEVVNAGAGEVTGLVIRARGQLKITINHTTVAKIDDLIDEIQAHHRELGDFAAKHIAPAKKSSG